MEAPISEDKNPEVTLNVSTSSSSNQFIPDNLELPDDTFRMSLDNFSVIGENVTIGREISVDGNTPTVSIPYTPSMVLSTPFNTPDIESTPDSTTRNSPPIAETPKVTPTPENRKPQTLLQLSLTKKNENDVFVKPSPVQEVMSPAKMLQFEIEASSATPTMKRAAIDFDFFNKNKFDEFFEEDPVKNKNEESVGSTDGSTYKETPVIVKANTVRHEIGYGGTSVIKNPPDDAAQRLISLLN